MKLITAEERVWLYEAIETLAGMLSYSLDTLGEFAVDRANALGIEHTEHPDIKKQRILLEDILSRQEGLKLTSAALLFGARHDCTEEELS